MGKVYPTHTTAEEAARAHKAETGHEVGQLSSLNGIVVDCSECDAFTPPAGEDSE